MSVKDRAFYLGQTALLGAVLVGCGDGSPKNNRQPSQTSIQPTATTEIKPIPFSSSENLRNALESFGLKVTQTLKPVSLYDGQTTTIENYAQTPLNETVVNSIFQTVEGILSTKNFALPVKVKGKDMLLAIGRKPGYQRNIFIIPDDVLPIQAVETNYPPEAQLKPVYTFFDSKNATTVLRHLKPDSPYLQGPYYKSDAQLMTAAFAIENCQQAGIAVFLEPGIEHFSQDEIVLAMELACNSLGLAIGSASMEKSYDEYLVEATRRSLTIGLAGKPAAKGDYPFIVIPRSVYESLPKTGTIVKP